MFFKPQQRVTLRKALFTDGGGVLQIGAGAEITSISPKNGLIRVKSGGEYATGTEADFVPRFAGRPRADGKPVKVVRQVAKRDFIASPPVKPHSFGPE